ncbi:MAG TPA: carboxyl transferase domain-containing protein [Pseudonocardia sp.]|nr:carboxyl transferase domain-containing protein [Pseudonocardia sp.]
MPPTDEDRLLITRLLVANRGEVAARVLHTTATLGLPSVLVCAADDTAPAWAEHVEPLDGSGPAAYLGQAALVEVARRTGCDGVHPGWGFLAESASFARSCGEAGLTFIGPSPDALELFGDKAAARARAASLGVEVLPGTPVLTGEDEAADLAMARDFVDKYLSAHGSEHSAVLVKAVAGGGGRGIREIDGSGSGNAALADTLRRCASEARHGFGDGSLYLERRLTGARHIEVQLVGDSSGSVVAIGDRDCSLQRHRQKLVEIAPAPGLSDDLRARLWAAAEKIGGSVDRLGLATAEFLVPLDPDGSADDPEFVFLEVNARLQVEHTVTEQVTGLDLVSIQLRLAAGDTLADLGLKEPPVSTGVAIQARVNAERITGDGEVHAGAGELTRFSPPSGRGIRVDTHVAPGYVVSPRYDTLLAKVIVTGGSLEQSAALAERSLRIFGVEGTPTNRELLRALLRDPALGAAPTDHVDAHLRELLATAEVADPGVIAAQTRVIGNRGGSPAESAGEPPESAITRGGEGEPPESAITRGAGEYDGDVITAPRAGVVVELPAGPGDSVGTGGALIVLEAMKMEYVVPAPGPVRVTEVLVSIGQAVAEGTPLLAVDESDQGTESLEELSEHDLEHVRDDLAEVHARQRTARDEGRAEAVAKWHDKGRRTARENLADLCDPDTFVEYGALAVAAQRRRRELDDLISNTAADGIVVGTARIGGRRAAVLSYDYTVLAGTQGVMGHRKTDRLLEIAQQERLPTVFFAEGGGGRPGDTDQMGFTGLDVPTFRLAAQLSGRVPTVGVVSGYCFAGNAALAAVCDVLIGTEGASLGMGGPAMIEGGGLGIVAPLDVGPMPVHLRSGVIDLLAADDAAAVEAARRYLSYLSGPVDQVEFADQRLLRHAVPENRVRAYKIRPVLETLFDTGSVLELRAGYGHGMVTALARLNGHAVGVLANNPDHLGGAIDGEAAAKTDRFLRICDGYGLPVISLCDTPGFMVGPEAEATGLVRQVGGMFAAGSQLSVPMAMVVLRKGYGLGAMAMAGAATRSTRLTVCWPTGEFGGMNLEGATRLRYRKELAAIDDEAERQAKFEELVARQYEHGKALTTATVFDVDDVIDPADTRLVLAGALGLDA